MDIFAAWNLAHIARPTPWIVRRLAAVFLHILANEPIAKRGRSIFVSILGGFPAIVRNNDGTTLATRLDARRIEIRGRQIF